jgi:hypothetical protein
VEEPSERADIKGANGFETGERWVKRVWEGFWNVGLRFGNWDREFGDSCGNGWGSGKGDGAANQNEGFRERGVGGMGELGWVELGNGIWFGKSLGEREGNEGIWAKR